MNKQIAFYIFFGLISSFCSSTQSKLPKTDYSYQTFDEWYTACKNLPFYRTTGTNYSNKPEKLDQIELEKTLKKFIQTIQPQFVDKTQWVNGNCPDQNFYENHEFSPFAQKLTVPISAEVIFHGDLHGDIHSLVEQLNHLKKLGYLDNDFKIIKPNVYLVYLGDYVDRGNFGIEVIYTLMRLKIANPDHVVMVRGNHEDPQLNYSYGFAQELAQKFPSSNNRKLLGHVSKIYDLLPAVLYVGSNDNYFQCNHGGMEPGYLPHNLLKSEKKNCCELIQKLKRKSNIQKYIDTSYRKELEHKLAALAQKKRLNLESDMKYTDFIPDGPFDIGFLWNDFIVNDSTDIDYQKGRGWCYGKKPTEKLLQACAYDKNKVVGVLRAHQHGDPEMMHEILEGPTPGVAKQWNAEKENDQLWDGMVATFNVAPDTGYGKNLTFDYDTYGIIKTGKEFPKDWSFHIANNSIFSKSQ